MPTKRKAASAATAAQPAATKKARRPNGIKGITKASKSNDPVRDTVLSTLTASGIAGPVEARVVFGHCGIYVGGKLLGWVGPGHPGFGIRVGNQRSATQRGILEAAGCYVREEDKQGYHSKNPYWAVPVELHTDAPKLRDLAEKVLATLPEPKKRTPKARGGAKQKKAAAPGKAASKAASKAPKGKGRKAVAGKLAGSASKAALTAVAAAATKAAADAGTASKASRSARASARARKKAAATE